MLYHVRNVLPKKTQKLVLRLSWPRGVQEVTVVCAAPLFNGTPFPCALIMSDSRVSFSPPTKKPLDNLRKLHILGDTYAVGIVNNVKRAKSAVKLVQEHIQKKPDRSFENVKRLLRWAAEQQGVPKKPDHRFRLVLVGVNGRCTMAAEVIAEKNVDVKSIPDFAIVSGDPSVVKTVRPEIGKKRVAILPSHNAPPWLNELIRFEAAMDACVKAALQANAQATVGGPIQSVILIPGSRPKVKELALIDDPDGPTAGLAEMDSEWFSLADTRSNMGTDHN